MTTNLERDLNPWEITVSFPPAESVPAISEKKPSWLKTAEAYSERIYHIAYVRDFGNPANLMAFYLLIKAGVLQEPDSSGGEKGRIDVLKANTSFTPSQLEEGIPLFQADFTNPSLFRHFCSTIPDNKTKRLCKKFIEFMEVYRSVGKNWWEARVLFTEKNKWMLRLHESLSYVLLTNLSDWRNAYYETVDLLDRVADERKKEGMLSPTLEEAIVSQSYPVNSVLYKLRRKNPNRDAEELAALQEKEVPALVRTPILKNAGDKEDLIDYKDFVFDLSLLRLIPGTSWIIVIGGSANSGKSTFTASLCRAMNNVVAEAKQRGVFGVEHVNVGLCDLDLVSPTSSYLLWGKKPERPAEKTPWTDKLAHLAAAKLRTTRRNANVVVADLPGVPDMFSQIIAENADFSIILDRDFKDSIVEWMQNVMSVHALAKTPRLVAMLHTRFGEQGRVSGLRQFSSKLRGKKEDLTTGRVVDLRRELVPDDPIIKFIAYYMLCDVIPGARMAYMDYRHRLYQALGVV